ncbi:4-diphosphocytidyl-2-C-methyl-D-erythritol kinase [Acrasis kona]|uniref:4-diphosphocytidyl-2-C-methyl-D-erythritol kinase n=1 Tax=Acrasis kona TaxID=1008807 RepID=A0AAW2ZGP5_9EUKA
MKQNIQLSPNVPSLETESEPKKTLPKEKLPKKPVRKSTKQKDVEPRRSTRKRKVVEEVVEEIEEVPTPKPRSSRKQTKKITPVLSDEEVPPVNTIIPPIIPAPPALSQIDFQTMMIEMAKDVSGLVKKREADAKRIDELEQTIRDMRERQDAPAIQQAPTIQQTPVLPPNFRPNFQGYENNTGNIIVLIQQPQNNRGNFYDNFIGEILRNANR